MADAVSLLTPYSLEQDDTKFTYRADYLIELNTTGATNDPNVALVAAETTGSFPARMSAFPSNAASFALGFSARPVNAQSHVTDKWIATVTWRPLDPGQKSSDSNPNPTARPTKLRLEYMETQEEIKELYNVTSFTGRTSPTLAPVTNSAKAVPQERFMQTVRTPVLVATKNFTSQSAVDALNTTYQNTLNDATFYGRAAHYAKFLSADVTEEVREFGYTYFQATIRVALGAKPWYFELDNVGFKAWTGTNCTGDFLNCVDKNGQDEPEPVKLAIDGMRAVENTEIVKIQYRFNAVSYTGIGIGTAW